MIDTVILWLVLAAQLLSYASITLHINRQLKCKGGAV